MQRFSSIVVCIFSRVIWLLAQHPVAEVATPFCLRGLEYGKFVVSQNCLKNLLRPAFLSVFQLRRSAIDVCVAVFYSVMVFDSSFIHVRCKSNHTSRVQCESAFELISRWCLKLILNVTIGMQSRKTGTYNYVSASYWIVHAILVKKFRLG